MTLIYGANTFSIGAINYKCAIKLILDLCNSFQILEFVNHVVSFTQIRGSIPLYWSQSGIKYKPTPKIEKGYFMKSRYNQLP